LLGLGHYQGNYLGRKAGLTLLGLLLNLLGAQLPGLMGVPLYLDNIGTFFVVALVGVIPGMAVGYLGNLFYSFQDPEWLYWGLFCVIMAWLAGRAADEGRFTRLSDMLRLVPVIVLFTGLLGEIFSWLLSGLGYYEDGIAAYASAVGSFLGVELPLARIIARCGIEALDKSLVLAAAWVAVQLARQVWPELKAAHFRKKLSPLRRRMVLLITASAGVTGMAVFLLACHTHYYMLELAVQATGGWGGFKDTLAFGGGLFSAMLGAEICIVAFSVSYIDWTLVEPVRKMTDAMRNFVGDRGEQHGKYEDAGPVTGLRIETHDELQTLQAAMAVTASDVVDYLAALNLKIEEIRQLHTNIISTIADIIESRDVTTGTHVKRTSAYAGIIALQLLKEGRYTDVITDDFVRDIQVAAPLHDVGKICIPDAVLSKPGKLTSEEFAAMKRHTTLGREIVRRARESLGEGEYLEMAQDLAAYHHEWWNGRGYPEGLKEQEIPLSARIMAVADVYDALTTVRPYKRAFTPEEARGLIMLEEKGIHFDPVVVDAFVHAFDLIEKVRRQTEAE